MKNKRRIVTFEPEPDVNSMLERAKEHGLTLAEILNQSLRIHGPTVIKKIALQQADKLKKLSAESFDVAELPEVGLAV